ncbi:hypothetical protein VTI28DRAFT_3445 [Corynascus sepedonium]
MDRRRGRLRRISELPISRRKHSVPRLFAWVVVVLLELHSGLRANIMNHSPSSQTLRKTKQQPSCNNKIYSPGLSFSVRRRTSKSPRTHPET